MRRAFGLMRVHRLRDEARVAAIQAVAEDHDDRLRRDQLGQVSDDELHEALADARAARPVRQIGGEPFDGRKIRPGDSHGVSRVSDVLNAKTSVFPRRP